MKLIRVCWIGNFIALVFLLCFCATSAIGAHPRGVSSAVASASFLVAQSSGEDDLSLLQPEELVNILNSTKSPKPLIIQVGFHVLYVQAHIPGSEYIGPSSSADAIQRLHKRVEALQRAHPIVLYCGCCPWSQCPNINPAYKELRDMGFTNVKVLYIAHNFGTDWADKGYPVAKGE